MLRFFTCIVLAIILVNLVTVSAHADTFKRVGILKCDSESNRFTVRFGVLHNDDALDKAELADMPDDLSQEWTSIPFQENQSCQLVDGQKVLLSVKNKQAFAYGMGGGDPDATFTLKINDKNIYYHETFYNGYGAGKYSINAVSYKDHQLKECSAYNVAIEKCLSQGKRRGCVFNTEKNKTIECGDVSKRLTGDALSNEESKELEKENEKISLQDSLSPFCKEMRVQVPSNGNEAYEYLGRILDGHLSAMSIDINNDGKIDKVFRVGGSSGDCASCGTHYFDGSYLMAFTDSQEKVSDLLSYMKEKGYEIDKEPNIKYLPEWGAYFISLGLADSSARYVYNIPFAFKGKNYIYAFETNREKTPSSSISKITKDHRVETVCKFP